jgi:selenocysteine lyase/cysteine desulfurase
LRASADEPRLVVDTSAARSSHIVGVRFADGRSAVSVGRELTARRVYVSVRGDAIRVAPHVYTDARDVGALIDGLAARRWYYRVVDRSRGCDGPSGRYK